MKRLYPIIILLILFSVSLSGQNKQNPKHRKIQAVIDSLRQEYAPDRRVYVFDVEVKGNTLNGYIYDSFDYANFCEVVKKYGYVNNVETLPAKELGEKTFGVINLSVADIREKPDFTEGMATQAILGTPILILQKDGWYRIQTPDGYIGWSQHFNFHPMTKTEFNTWTEAKKIIFTDYFGFAYSKPNKNSQTISDLVNGNMLKYEGEEGDFYKIAYPDGKIAYVLKSQCQPFYNWYSSLQLTKESIIEKAFTLMGIPYVWGGTSVKGMDCSGYTKQVLFMHGVILMRDASQQVNTGIPVDISKGYGNLQIGDLIFFGKKDQKTGKERIRHVGFYIGNNEFIHASGYIRISSLDPKKENYDEANTKEFIRASRVVGAVDTDGIWSIQNNPMYQVIK
ncbi:hypothetical protein M2451_001294 [Dysgonomonas sp. PFB1-18]|uniref:C40 family peptidase n=1 Tax=unclassified Dysgonomonas TaxID=2630389 RepID=UPI0024746ED5|nr:MULTISPECIES: NlpC/P60 family protein [unclassified Dysgonomonas]MDH6308728.1 hypothetical protein [Dysgonomonas sp. PF1-14]MDH6338575.1 hypothetical protein [Dysgonomonas sp. PF1-16]MDH6379977.1 hypothetical protein [Dysgonomonas sp. PFB1-18]MDH6397403.1 hypothetical protein [Dysgonomonas sp. PF1-23]